MESIVVWKFGDDFRLENAQTQSSTDWVCLFCNAFSISLVSSSVEGFDG